MKRIHIDCFRKYQLCVILPVMLLAGCGKAPEPVEEPPARLVKLLTIGSGEASMQIEYPGEIKAARSVNLGFVRLPARLSSCP